MEIAVVIVVLSLLLAMIAGIATAMLGQQRREVTRQKLAGVETALALFVSQNRRLPCPALGTDPSGNSAAGIERRTVAGLCNVDGANDTQTHGVIPWRTLGLAESDITDGWGNRISYRVAPELVLDTAMDLTACDPGGTFGIGGTPAGRCNQAGVSNPSTDCNKDTFPARCTPPQAYTAGKGLRVRNLNATVTLIMDPSPASGPSTGAAYVAISHGENGAGAYNNSGTLQSGAVASGTLEAGNNAANVVFNFSSSTGLAAANAFVDDFPVYTDGNGHFDDVVLRPSILTVATKAQLGPRAH